jgi:hypothetical protein
LASEPPFPPPPLSPDEPPPLPIGPGGGTPWERRDSIGFVSALVETTQQVLFRPAEFFEGMPVTGGVGGPLLYAVILGYLGLVAGTVYNVVFRSIVGSGLHQFGGGRMVEFQRFTRFLEGGLGATVQLVTGPIWIVIGVFVAAGILHVLLMVVGAAPRDFEATFRVVAYSHAVSVLGLVPFCGNVIGFVWWVVVATLGLRTVHRTSTGQALIAVLLPIFLCCCCCAGLGFLAAGSMASALRQFQ